MRLLLSVGALLAAGAVAALAAALSVSDARAPTELLPDLDAAAPGELSGVTADEPGRRRFLLGFGSAAENVGAGPLIVYGRRASRGSASMAATQIVLRSDRSPRRYPGVGSLVYVRTRERYVDATPHQHWHLLPFMSYELRSSSERGVVRRDHKTGFCLGDRYRMASASRLRAAPARAVYTRECGKGRPNVLTVREGISVGYGDDYDASLEGQYVDVTGLPAGRYELVHRVNAGRLLRESSYANNASSLALDLAWPRGEAEPPSIDVVARCADSDRCPPK